MSQMNIPYGKQNITQKDIDAVVDSLKHPYLTQGPKVQAFEESFADYIGAKYAVAVSNGTAALHLCSLALDVNEKSKVITTPITFAASANCIKYCGGEVVFSDVNPHNLLLNINKVEDLLKASSRETYAGIIPVDFAGYPVNLEEYRTLADKYNLWLIEDACHAPGGYFTDSNGKKQQCGNGNFADLAIFSFHPVKHIASGEGGMITTNNNELFEKLRRLRTHGITKDETIMHENHGGWYYEMHELGYNYRIPDILCALGLSQLQRADEGLFKRRKIAKRYDVAFKNTVVKTIPVPENVGHAYHLYILQVNNRKEVYDFLISKGIYAQIHYIPIHTLPFYRNLQSTPVVLSVAEQYYSQCISIPMFPTLTNEEQQYVIENVLAIAK